MYIENLYACMCAISKSYGIKKALNKSLGTAPTNVFCSNDFFQLSVILKK